MATATVALVPPLTVCAIVYGMVKANKTAEHSCGSDFANCRCACH